MTKTVGGMDCSVGLNGLLSFVDDERLITVLSQLVGYFE
jgi:hypothetical protein